MIVLNLLRSIFFLSLLFLQACHGHEEINGEQGFKTAAKAQVAAAYNSQLGMAYLQQGDIPRAKRKLLTALDLNPGSSDVNASMAYFLEKTGDSKGAKTYYQRALSLSAHSGAQLNNYGAFLCRQGDYRNAERLFLKAVQDIHYINTAAAYENAGLCAAAIPDYKKAKQYFLKALTQDQKRKQSLLELVNIELKQKKPKLALLHLQNYSNLLNTNSELLAVAVNAARQTGNVELAELYRKRLATIKHSRDYTGANNEYNSSNG
ncbi:fimbrial biogenesis and twitching motility protein PilF [Legionella jordanis]|uniref:Fimbrial biogenesis and twitching motility protein PilF n=2 Tax=Legionella jordanis TaxID=456 RepID=A0A0W0VC18_9GAMM|nr:type IV pilus biogenesis/stability protein PilW [Legionella jordanis]KTD17177.1 fimbrial biogenesis and twitching motility protein PilF [Legionella jordanis]VEH12625.1 type IV pilus assembly protein PilF [Legionella jordanis]